MVWAAFTACYNNIRTVTDCKETRSKGLGWPQESYEFVVRRIARSLLLAMPSQF